MSSQKQKEQTRSVPTDPTTVRRLSRRCPKCGAMCVPPCHECLVREKRDHNRLLASLAEPRRPA